MIKQMLWTVVVALAATATAWGQTKVLVLKDGRRFEGVVTTSKNGYRIKTRMATLDFTTDEVDKVIDRSDPKDEYRQKLASIDPGKADQHVDLGQWAEKRGMLDEAREQYEKALDLQPNMELASLLLRRVKAAQEKKSAGPEAAGSGQVVVEEGGGGVVKLEDLVSEEDIYRIRMGEFVPRRDTRLSVRFQNDAQDKFIRSMRGVVGRDGRAFDENVFKRMSMAEKAAYMVENTNWNDPIRNDIQLRSDPEPLREFRASVLPKVAVSCGSVQCHGAPGGQGGLRLLTQTARNDRVDYSNFMILSDAVYQRWHLIDRQNPDNSLLLTMAMRKEDVLESQAHPGKDEIPAVYPNTRATAYTQMLDWIRSLRPAPEGGKYGVSYKPPNASAPDAEQPPVVPVAPEEPPQPPAATQPALDVAPPPAQVPPAGDTLLLP